MPTLERIVKSQWMGFRGIIGRAMLRPFISTVAVLRPFFIDELHIQGQEHLVEKDGTPLRGPRLWLPKHESWIDFVALPRVWREAGCPIMNGVSRAKYTPSSPLLSTFISYLMRSTIFVEIERTSMLAHLPPEEQHKLRTSNQQKLEALKQNYRRGIHVAIAPEGTSKSNGFISPIKSGAYHLSHIRTTDRIGRVPCVPIGNTYDFMSSPKPLVFLQIGKPFWYEPVAHLPDEPEEEYLRRDLLSFTNRIKQLFVEYNTITLAQLGSEYLLKKAEDGTQKVAENELKQNLQRHISALTELPSIYIDRALLEYDQLTTRFNHFLNSVRRDGFLFLDGGINSDRILSEPKRPNGTIDLDQYKSSNRLRYSAHRLRDVMVSRPDITAVLSSA